MIVKNKISWRKEQGCWIVTAWNEFGAPFNWKLYDAAYNIIMIKGDLFIRNRNTSDFLKIIMQDDAITTHHSTQFNDYTLVEINCAVERINKMNSRRAANTTKEEVVTVKKFTFEVGKDYHINFVGTFKVLKLKPLKFRWLGHVGTVTIKEEDEGKLIRDLLRGVNH